MDETPQPSFLQSDAHHSPHLGAPPPSRSALKRTAHPEKSQPELDDEQRAQDALLKEAMQSVQNNRKRQREAQQEASPPPRKKARKKRDPSAAEAPVKLPPFSILGTSSTHYFSAPESASLLNNPALTCLLRKHDPPVMALRSPPDFLHVKTRWAEMQRAAFTPIIFNSVYSAGQNSRNMRATLEPHHISETAVTALMEHASTLGMYQRGNERWAQETMCWFLHLEGVYSPDKLAGVIAPPAYIEMPILADLVSAVIIDTQWAVKNQKEPREKSPGGLKDAVKNVTAWRCGRHFSEEMPLRPVNEDQDNSDLSEAHRKRLRENHRRQLRLEEAIDFIQKHGDVACIDSLLKVQPAYSYKQVSVRRAASATLVLCSLAACLISCFAARCSALMRSLSSPRPAGCKSFRR
jgi:hypothetical protein